MKKIPLVDLSAQYQEIGKDIDRKIHEIISKNAFILGEEVEMFEKEFATLVGARYCVGVSSGTDALHLTHHALNIGSGDEVITTPFTFTATAEAIVLTGAKPVFADIQAGTYNIDPEQIENKITKKTKAIIPVHLFGLPADMNRIMEIARKYKLIVIEDAAQAHGGKIRIMNNELRIKNKNRRNSKFMTVGSIGDAGCFSFYPGKNLGAFGDAGAITTNDKKLYKKLYMLRNHGRTEKYVHKLVGFGCRLDNLQAGILRIKLKRLPFWNRKRRKSAKLYQKLLSEREVKIQDIPEWAESVFHLFVIEDSKREKLSQLLNQSNIATGVHYPIPLHLQPAYKFLGYRRGSLPVSERVAKNILSLPIYPELKEKDIRKISSVVKSFQKSV